MKAIRVPRWAVSLVVQTPLIPREIAWVVGPGAVTKASSSAGGGLATVGGRTVAARRSAPSGRHPRCASRFARRGTEGEGSSGRHWRERPPPPPPLPRNRRFPSLAVRAPACMPAPFVGLAACGSKPPPHPPAPTQEPPLSLTPGPSRGERGARPVGSWIAAGSGHAAWVSPARRGEQGRSVPGSQPAADALHGSLPRGGRAAGPSGGSHLQPSPGRPKRAGLWGKSRRLFRRPELSRARCRPAPEPPPGRSGRRRRRVARVHAPCRAVRYR